MKRHGASNEPSEESRRPKSARFTLSTPLEPQYLYTSDGGQAKDAYESSLARATQLCEKYNRFLPFTRAYAGEARESIVACLGLNFQQTVRKIETILEQALVRVGTESDELERQLDE